MRSHKAVTPELKRIRLAILSFYFNQGLCFSSWASRIPTIKTNLGLDDGEWGTILLMIPIGQICGMSISGFMASRIGSKNILPYAFIAYLVALLLIGLSTTEYHLLMSMIAFGFAGNFCNISVNMQSVTVEAQYERPIMGAFHGSWSIAGFAGSVIGLLMIYLGITPLYHFLIVGAMVLVSFKLNIRYLQDDIKKERSATDKRRNKPESFLFLLGLIAFCGMAAEGTMADWSGLYLKDVVKVSDGIVPLGLAAYMITMASARFMVDRITERIGRRRMVQISGALIATGMFLAVAFPSLPVTLLAFMIIGMGTSSIVPTVYSVAGRRTKVSTGIALTIVSSVSFLGFLLGPPVIGYISQATNLRYSFALVGVLAIGIIILASILTVLKEEDNQHLIKNKAK